MDYFLDTETTGFSAARGDAIVEVAIVNERGKVVLDSLVHPGRDIPWQATNVHGITNSMVIGAPTLDELLPTIRKLIKGHRVVMYNSIFDEAFFPCRLRDAGEIQCAMRRFAKVCGSGTVKLDKAAERVGHIWVAGAHRALPDALACRSVWQWCERH